MTGNGKEPESRRQFLRVAAGFGTAGVLALSRPALEAEEPFDSLSPEVVRHARRNGLVMIRRPAPSQLSSRTQIAPKTEPGQRLIVSGLVMKPDGATPAPGVTVYAYNTDAQGYYGENHTEYPPRLYGWMKTDGDGKFEVETIRPGSYPGMRVPAHIHFTFWGGGFPLQWVDELQFEGDPYLTPAMKAADAARGEFHLIQRLVPADDGALHCSVRIKLLRESNFA